MKFLYSKTCMLKKSALIPMFAPLPIILAYTPYFNGPIFTEKILKSLESCPNKCKYVEDRKFYSKAAVAIFHARDFTMDDLLYSDVNYKRLNLFFSMESFAHEEIKHKKIPLAFFNITATYRKDSTLWNPYDFFEDITPSDKNNSVFVWTDEQVDKAISQKRHLALSYVSNCCTHSRREVYLDMMMKYYNITAYGRCIKKDANIDDEIKSHFFYLAFENSVSKDYVTEKFWRIKKLIVPVVLKRSILKGIVEDEYFIAADDYDSPKKLIEHLMYISKNLEEYKKYFGWTRKYKKTFNMDVRLNTPQICELCKMSVENHKHQIENIQKWWENESELEEKYVEKITKQEIFYFCNE